MNLIDGKPCWEWDFDTGGTLSTDPGGAADEIAAAGIDNLFVFSHGWNDQPAAGRSLYENMFALIATAADQHPELGRVGFAGIVWPSIWWPDQAGSAGGPTATAAQSIEAPAAGPVNVNTAMTGAEIASSMGQSFDPATQAVIAQMGTLIDQGIDLAATGATDAQQTQNVQAFHQLLQQVTAAAVGATEDSGESALFDSTQPVVDYGKLADTMGSGASTGAAESFGIDFGKIWSGAKDALRVASFWQMKSRAGAVGRHGLGPLLELLHGRSVGTRVHLIGHSFGARLVSNALIGISSPNASPVASLLLIQGAFSHWSFAGADMPFGVAGSLNGSAASVHGPLLSTFSKSDWAVGVWYPKASFLAGDFVQAQEVPKWGGMGSDGFQSSSPAADLTVGPSGTPYHLAPGTFHRVDANTCIADTAQSAFAGAHCDIVHPEIAWLAACAAVPAGP